MAPVPALIGLILGFVGIGAAKKENKPTGMAKAGAVLSALALVILVAWIGYMATQKPDGKTWGEFFEDAQSQIEQAQQEAIEAQQEAIEAQQQLMEAVPDAPAPAQ
ncbi:MAG: hypothetical protein AAF514_01405 [Verrucomicrobiota bacterium]